MTAAQRWFRASVLVVVAICISLAPGPGLADAVKPTRPPAASLESFPTVPQVKADFGGAGAPNARQAVALLTLNGFIRSNFSAQLDAQGKLQGPAAQRRTEYGDAYDEIWKNVDDARKQAIAMEAQDLELNHGMRSEVLLRYFPEPLVHYYTVVQSGTPEAQWAAELAGIKQRATEQKAFTARIVAPLERDRALAAKHRVDMSVFGVALGRPLSLPACTANYLDALASSLGRALGGAPETCVNQTGGAFANSTQRMVEAMLGRGPTAATAGVSHVAVVLADNKCPSWLKATLGCQVTMAVQEGYALGVAIRTDVEPATRKRVLEALTEKYGAKFQPGEAMKCVSGLTGLTVAEGQGRAWSLPGLHVRFAPFDANCANGMIEVETAHYHAMKHAAVQERSASDPKM